MVTSFAVYYLGEKLGSDLRLQRDKLRQYFRKESNLQSDGKSARQLVRSIGRLAEFRHQYWDTNEIDKLPQRNAQERELKLCLRYIADTKTSTTIPILARYWIEYGEESELHFLRATKAVAAFLTLRRSITGGTARIDSDFRSVMKKGSRSSTGPLCVGEDFSNRILNIEELQERLQSLLAVSPFYVEGKSTWLAKAQEDIPLARASSDVCRFLLLAAAHHAQPDSNVPGLLTVEDVIPGTRTDLFNHQTWVSEKYATVEHIAPDSEPSSGWDADIYARTATRHTIGNLVLLPEEENDVIGNASWEKKRTFYRALSTSSISERSSLIELAASEGYVFGKKTRRLLDDQETLSLLDPLKKVEHWTECLIRDRTKNILELAWIGYPPGFMNDYG